MNKCDDNLNGVSQTVKVAYSLALVRSPLKCEDNMDNKKTWLIGSNFGRWVVIGPSVIKNMSIHWWCKCECGSETYVSQSNLFKGASRSCGCLKRELSTIRATKHGHNTKKQTAEYRCWHHMIFRCDSPKDASYHRYGGRGITVCKEWYDFRNFLKDMGLKPFSKAELDRIDNDGNYEPGNCRWATRSQNTSNQSRSVKLTYNGRTTNITHWAEELGVLNLRISHLLKRGLPFDWIYERLSKSKKIVSAKEIKEWQCTKS